MRALVTGATGLVGSEVVRSLTTDSGFEVWSVSRRGASDPRAVAWRMGRDAVPDVLQDRTWDVIVHAAADTRWTLPKADAYRANVESVRCLEPLATPGCHVVYVSTAYSTGLRGNVESNDPADYRNTYEWSKAAAERLATAMFDDLTIIRPPLIIGRRADGMASRFSGMYTMLRAVARSLVPAVVARPEAYFDVTPVDDVAAAVVKAVQFGPSKPPAIHTLGRGAASLRVKDAIALLIDELNLWRKARGVRALTMPPIVEPERWERFFLPFARDELSNRQLQVIDKLSNFSRYLCLTEPIDVSCAVPDVAGAMRSSVRFWADANRATASAEVRSWSRQ